MFELYEIHLGRLKSQQNEWQKTLLHDRMQQVLAIPSALNGVLSLHEVLLPALNVNFMASHVRNLHVGCALNLSVNSVLECMF